MPFMRDSAIVPLSPILRSDAKASSPLSVYGTEEEIQSVLGMYKVGKNVPSPWMRFAVNNIQKGLYFRNSVFNCREPTTCDTGARGLMNGNASSMLEKLTAIDSNVVRDP